MTNHEGIDGVHDVRFPKWDTNIWKEWLVGGGAVRIPLLNKKYYQVEVASAFPESTFSEKIPTQKDGSSSILETLTTGSHQVNLRSMCDPYCFKNIVWDETGRWLLIVNISYKPIIYWRILIQYEGLLRQFSHLKKLRSLVDPSRVYNIYIYIYK